MLNRIRFKDEAAEAIYKDQGLHDIEDFSWFAKDLIINLWKVWYRPGRAKDDVTTNHGVKVSDITKENIQIMIDLINNKSRVPISYIYGDLILVGVLNIKCWWKLEDNHQDTNKN